MRRLFLNRCMKLGPDILLRRSNLGRPSVDQRPRFNELMDRVSRVRGPRSMVAWTYSTGFCEEK
jgi:hypothetical protein